MRDQLVQYVNLLFAGTSGCEEIKQEILQNTLDRYDDLIAEGKVPEAAYRLAITGIGDINEILGTEPNRTTYAAPADPKKAENDSPAKKLLRAVAVGLYIISFLPMFILSELGMSTLGFCGTLTIVAIATVLIMLGSKKSPEEDAPENISVYDPKAELRRSIGSVITAIGVALYFIISFATGAWYVTWVIFPLTGAVKGLVKAILDLKEAMQNEE